MLELLVSSGFVEEPGRGLPGRFEVEEPDCDLENVEDRSVEGVSPLSGMSGGVSEDVPRDLLELLGDVATGGLDLGPALATNGRFPSAVVSVSSLSSMVSSFMLSSSSSTSSSDELLS